MIQEGLNKKAGMVTEAKQRLEQKRVQLQEKEMRKVELEKIKDEAQALKEEAERPEKEALDYYRKIEEEEKRRQEEEKAALEMAEAAEYFRELDTNQDGQVTVAELQVNIKPYNWKWLFLQILTIIFCVSQARHGLDTNKDGEVSEEEAQFFLSDKESFDIDSFKDSGFALIKPYLDLEKVTPAAEADDGAVPPSQEFHPPDHPMMTPPPEDVDPEKPDYPMNTPAPPTDIEEYDEEEREEDDEDYDISDHEEPVEVEKEAEPESKYDANTQQLIQTAEEARKRFTDAERQLRDIEREVQGLSESLDKDYGPDSVFAVLQVS